MVLAPSAKAILPDGVPDVTATPLTVTVALASCVVGVTVTDAVASGTDVVYVVVVPVVPVIVSVEDGVSANVVSEALFDILCTTIKAVLVVVPSCDVTTVVMVLSPLAKAMLPDAVPEVTAVPFTVTVALGSSVVGVTVTDAIALLTVVV